MELTPKIIYEDESLLVVDKPPGLLTHPSGHSQVPSLSDWLLENYSGLGKVGEPISLTTGQVVPRAGLVHRLDRGTSGLLLVAKVDASYQLLKQAFRERAIKKTYRLIVRGTVKKGSGVIKAAIGRSERDPRRRAARASSAAGERLWREAETSYRVLKVFKAHTYLEAYPQTGRTHQLRVHFQSIGHPVVADNLYDPAGSPSELIVRPALHAYSLLLPGNLPGLSPHLFLSPLPPDLFSALAFVARP